MQSFENFIDSRKNLNLKFKIRNTLSIGLLIVLSFFTYQTFSQELVQPLYKIMLFMTCVSLALSLSILVVKLRLHREVSINSKSLKKYITEAILIARKDKSYTALNQLLDSKYSVHTILTMSSFPESAFNFDELSKWVKLKEAMTYFKTNNFTELDLMDDEKMRDYLKSVYPEFLIALGKAI